MLLSKDSRVFKSHTRWLLGIFSLPYIGIKTDNKTLLTAGGAVWTKLDKEAEDVAGDAVIVVARH